MTWRRAWPWGLIVAAGLALAFAIEAHWAYKRWPPADTLYAPAPVPEPEPMPDDTPAALGKPTGFDGPTDALSDTVVVPTLDTPIPPGKSAIWCSSFQIAWNRARRDLAGGPIQVQGAHAVADRLNRADQSEADLPEGSYYAAAGLVKDGIGARIQEEMALQFPSVPRPEFDDAAGAVALTYAYLESGVRYRFAFSDLPHPMTFTDAAGKQSDVRCFGILNADDVGATSSRSQVAVLFDDPDGGFVLDLCKDSQPNQIVLGRVSRRDTLAATLADLEARITAWTARGQPAQFRPDAVLLVPNMDWRVSHHFSELEGTQRILLNPRLRGTWLGRASQMIRFRLDRHGALLGSHAGIEFNDGHREYWFDRPFILYLKLRGAKHPFFVMWVDNAELLSKQMK
jgi:hypothetical protein